MNLKVFTLLFINALTFDQSFAGCTCGKENIGSRIIGGSKVSENRYPWMASLSIRSRDGKMFACGGSLINNRYILTAAHCLENAQSITATLGTNNRRSGGMQMSIISTKTNGYDKRRTKNDIALLKLKDPVEFTKEITPICLPTEDMRDFTKLTVAGWGYTVPGGKSSDMLLDVTVNLYSFKKCNREWGNSLSDSQLCAADIGKDSCGGDSGGPLMVRQRGKMSVVGIVSFGSVECGSTRNSVYTRVTSFLDWIQKETADADSCN